MLVFGGNLFYAMQSCRRNVIDDVYNWPVIILFLF